VVLHWTATPAVASAIGDAERMRRWLRRGTGSSTHFVVCRSGLVLQAADVADEWTAHAGRSAWRDVTGAGSVNGCSVGVDLELVGGLRAPVVQPGAFYDAYEDIPADKRPASPLAYLEQLDAAAEQRRTYLSDPKAEREKAPPSPL
jgi:hypothetical protein